MTLHTTWPNADRARKGTHHANAARRDDWTFLADGPLNQITALRYSRLIEAERRYWTTVHSYPFAGAVLEIRSRTRPYPCLMRCQTVEDCRSWLTTQPTGTPSLALLTDPDLRSFIANAKHAGLAAHKAAAQARERGYRCSNTQWRQLWRHAT